MTSRILSTTHGTNRSAFGPVEWALFIGVGITWGGSFLFIDVGLEAFSPGMVTLLRVGLGAVTLALFPASRRPIERADWPRLIVVSMLWVAIPLSLFPIAQQWIDSAVAGMLNGMMPMLTALIAAAMLSEAPAGRQVAGLVVGFGGVVCISLPTIGEGSSAALGVALVVVATLCYALAVNIVAPLQQRYGSLPVLSRALVIATVLVLPRGLVALPTEAPGWAPVAAMVALGVVGTGLAFIAMGTLVGRAGATRASMITYVIPVVALLLGVGILGEHVTPLQVGGCGLVVIGAILASRREV
ncbi:MAG TPA: DMT family transporter [Acidimicrobiia bacterium]|nr:DMT family transporter [Acidimicrobiia bacterium]